MRVLAVVLVGVLAAHAQSAKVIQLSPEDAAWAKKLNEAHKEMDQREKVFHDQIIRKYLVTTDDKGDVNYGNAVPWYDPEDKSAGLGVFLTGSGVLTVSGGLIGVSGGEPHCETAQEKAARRAQEAKEKKEAEAYRKAHPQKYFKPGWFQGFEYSEDYQFIVPTAPPSSGGISSMQGLTPGWTSCADGHCIQMGTPSN